MENTTIYIAIYGAVLSTFVFFWSIYSTLRDRAILEISTNVVHLIDDGKKRDEKDFIVEVTNKGRRVAMVDEVGFIRSNGKQIVVSLEKIRLLETEKHDYVITQEFLKKYGDLKYVYCKDSTGKIVKGKVVAYDRLLS